MLVGSRHGRFHPDGGDVAVQYLESFDSVRAGQDEPVEGLGHRYTELQAFLEVVLALAMGRDVVVPQSYAFDSTTFLAVAELVLEARRKAEVGLRERPLRIHLRDGGTFDEAVAGMLRRAGGEDEPPFHSSAFPDLATLDRGAVLEMSRDLDRFMTWADDEAAGRLQLVRDEFRTLSPVVPQPRRGRPGLAASVARLVTPSADVAAYAATLPDEARGVFERLRSAVGELEAVAEGRFGQRSLLRAPRPWAGGTDGPSARDVVGEDLPLVVEFVDTAYNRVVVDSIGDVPALYTTSVVLGPDLDQARLIAQDLALVGLVPDEAGDDPPPDQDDSSFDVALRTGAVRSSADLAGEVDALLDRGIDALAELFRARAEGGPKARDNDFWSGVRKVERAAAQGDGTAFRRAREEHMAAVVDLLRAPGADGLSARDSFQMVMGGAGAVAPALIASGPLWLTVTLTAAGAMAPTGIKQVTRRRADRRNRRRLASALGTFIEAAPGPGPR